MSDVCLIIARRSRLFKNTATPLPSPCIDKNIIVISNVAVCLVANALIIKALLTKWHMQMKIHLTLKINIKWILLVVGSTYITIEIARSRSSFLFDRYRTNKENTLIYLNFYIFPIKMYTYINMFAAKTLCIFFYFLRPTKLI